MASNFGFKIRESEAAHLYSVRSIPHTVLTDQESTIIAKGLRGNDIDSKLAELLKQKRVKATLNNKRGGPESRLSLRT